MDESSTDYRAYYYATCQDITQAQMRERDNIPIIDISRAKAFMDQYGIQGVCSDEAHYPSKLLTVPSPPTVLFIKGDITCISTPTIAIVGPRKMSDYAKQLIDLLFVELSHYRLTTISGLAE